MTTPLFDTGLQPERTELAWRRTALTLAVGSLVAMRLLPAALGSTFWFFPGVVGLVVAGAIWILAHLRYRRFYRALRTSRLTELPDGRLLVVLAGTVFALGLLGLATFILITN